MLYDLMFKYVKGGKKYVTLRDKVILYMIL